MRKSGKNLAAALGALALLAMAGSAQAQVKPGSAEITRVTGQVEIRRQGQTQWVPAVVGARLAERDEIRSFAGGSAELRLPDSSTLLLSENSRLVMNKLEFGPQGQGRTAFFHLAVGKVRAVITRAAITLVRARQSNFAISTPTAVAAARGTDMVVSHNPAADATIVASLAEPAKGEAPEAGLIECTSLKRGTKSALSVNNFVKVEADGNCSPPSELPPALEQLLSSALNPFTAGSPELTKPFIVIPPPSVVQAAATTGATPGAGTTVVDTGGLPTSFGSNIGATMTGPAP